MDKRQIAARIDRLAAQLSTGTEKTDAKVNEELGVALNVSDEAVRQWRKAKALPKLENLEDLVKYLGRQGVPASVEHILLGVPATKLTNVELLERIAEEGDELDLLRLFRTSNPSGQEHMMMGARAIQQAHPRAANVASIPQRKKRKP